MNFYYDGYGSVRVRIKFGSNYNLSLLTIESMGVSPTFQNPKPLKFKFQNFKILIFEV